MKTPENVPDNNVGRKTPEEIKQGLVVCYSEDDGGCIECPFRLAGYADELDCYEQLKRDALDLILQLESRLAQAERERDAAVADCSRFPCSTCSDKENGDLCHNCNVRKDTTRTNYEWRGVCPENTKEESIND